MGKISTKNILLPLFLLLISTSLSFLDSVFLTLVKTNSNYAKNGTIYTVSLGKEYIEKNKTYFLSLGMIKGKCDIHYKDIVMNSNNGRLLKNQLSIYQYLSKYNGEQVVISCDQEEGFPGGLYFQPIIAESTLSYVIQLVRDFQKLGVPLIFIFLAIFYGLYSSRSRDGDNFIEKRLYVTCIVLYLLSSLHVPRFFLSSINATFLHIVLKTLSVYSIIALVSLMSAVKSKASSILTVSYLIISTIVFIIMPNELVYSYKIMYCIYPILALLPIRKIYQSNSSYMVSSIVMLLAFFFAYSMDIVSSFSSVRFYISHSLLSLSILVLVSYLKDSFEMYTKSVRATETLLESLEHCNNKSNLEDSITNLFKTFVGNNFQVKVSLDSSISTNGSNKHFYQIGKHLRVKIKPKKKLSPLEIKNFNFKLNYVSNFSTVIDESIELNYRITGKLIKWLKSDSVKHEKQFIVNTTFIDFCDYTKMVNQYGPKFGSFWENIFLPKVIDYLSPELVPERTEGDMILLISVDQYRKVDISEIIQKLFYIESDLAPSLFRDYMFEYAGMRASISKGMVTIFTDGLNIRTTGDSVNFGARMVGVCPNHTIIIDKNLSSEINKQDFELKSKKSILKKELIDAYVVQEVKKMAA